MKNNNCDGFFDICCNCCCPCRGPKGDRGPVGPMGPTGPKGEATTVLGTYGSYDVLIAAHPTGHAGDAYIAGGDLYVWNSSAQCWDSAGYLAGPKGDTGPQGPQGEVGPQGETGPKGDKGDTGEGAGAVFALSSGAAVGLTSGVAGERSTVAMVAVSGGSSIIAPNDPIDISANSLTAEQHTFTIPVNGVLTDLSYFFSLSSGASLGIDNLLYGRLYSAPADSDSFTYIADTEIAFPLIEYNAPIGTIRQGSLHGLNIPVSAGMRFMAVFYNTTVNSVTSTIYGFMSGSVRIK